MALTITLTALIAAQDASPAAAAPPVDPNRPNDNYPYWTTNDYGCVMECLKPFEEEDLPNPAYVPSPNDHHPLARLIV